MKKLLSIILAVLMIATTIPFAFAAGDGVPLTIDVTDVVRVYIGSEYDYYDEDGYILTGSSESAIVNVEESCDLTLKDVTLAQLRFSYAPDGSVMNITLEGTNEVTYYLMLSSEHLIFEGSDNATFKAPYLNTSGNDGTVTVNGGNIVLEMVTDNNVPTIGCADFIINGGTVTASNNNFYTIEGPVKLNGGTLNVISTSESLEAIAGDITMNKGALLTVSGTHGLIRKFYNNLMADGLAESDSFFVRYDTESEFVPVSDIKAALDGKTYAEIKIDAHEHDYSVGGICICGCPCPHTETVGHLCAVCGEAVSKCADEDRNHKCYICDETLSECTDGDKNHKCDLCGETVSECADEDTNHKCDYCGETVSECTDENRDYKCDYGCGYEFENNCDHLCHKTGFMGFIWKIVQLISKLFKLNPFCDCGAAHY
ncbi:MAG: hypothetical protein IJW86_03405 [Clostridia bacterium]|nr:hypothetical protein [Clostridia bacterium]